MSKPSIQPLADYVLLQQAEAENKTASGLYLPEKSTEKPKIATVLAIGQFVKNTKEGDKVVFKNYSTTEIRVEGVDYLLIREEDLLAKIV